MNKIYKLKYDRRRNQLVAVSELTTGAGKEATGSVAGLCGLQGVSTFRRLMGTLTPLAVLTGLVIGMLPGLALANPDLPVGGQVVAGQGSISISGNQMTIHQGTHGLVTSWHSFDIGQNHTVQFVQPDSSAVALNRVTGGHESQILGTLTANGQVMLVNPAGVMFGKGAKVNTAGLLASTKNISTEDFMAGRYTFSGGSHPGAEIVNQGSLTTTKGGYIVLAADRVRNSGTLSTPSGKTVLAAADRVTLQLDNTGLASVSVNGSVVNALVENSGLIAATNGQVYLTARGKDMLLNTVVNNSGTVEARGLNQRGGEIVLDGGESGVVSQSGMLLADSETGRGGKITVQGANIHLAGGSRTSATGRTGGGEVYVGGGWQGKDAAIRNASKVVMDRDAVIDVSATEKGDGGKAVLWSEDHTNFRGRILAKGGAQSGNGGQVETSSHHNLQAFGDVDASALNGRGGNWLLDPTDITITGTGTTNTGIEEGTEGADHVFSPNVTTGSQVLASKINDQLNNGTSVTIKTTGVTSDTGTQKGNITVNADISKTGGENAGLTLEANGSINITNHYINATVGKLDVNLYAAGSNNGNITLNNAGITTNGGNITLGQWVEDGATNSNKLGVSITGGSVLNASAASSPADTDGNITLTANNGATLSNATLTGNNITVDVSNATGDALAINSGSNLTAATNLTVTGKSEGAATGSDNYGVHIWGGRTLLSAGNTITLTGSATNGTDGAVNVGGINVSAPDVVIEGTSGAASATGKQVSGLKIDNINNTLSGGNLTLNGTATGNGATGVILTKASTNGTGNLTVNGNSASGVGVSLNASTLTGGNVTVTGTSGSSAGDAGKGLEITGGNLNATTGSLSLTGLMNGGAGADSKGGFGAHIHGGSTFTAVDKITVNGSAVDGTNGGLNINGGTFSAKNTELNGQSVHNHVGVKIGNTITVTNGNLSITGTTPRVNNATGVTGLMSDGTLTIDVQKGYLNITGKVRDTSNSNISANTSTALNLSNATLKAAQGNVSLNAEMNGSTDGNAMILTGGTITAGENIDLHGTVTDGNGSAVRMTGGSMTASSGNITVTGTGAAGNGVALNGTTATGNNVTVTGTITSGNGNAGIEVNGGSSLTATNQQGNLTLTGTKTGGGDGYGIHISGGNTLTAGDTITLNGTVMDGNDGALNVDTNTFSAQNTVLSGTSSRNNIGVKAGGNISVTKGNLTVSGMANRTNDAPNVSGLMSGVNLKIDVQKGYLNITGNVSDTGHNATNASTSVALNLSAVNLTASNGCVSLNAEMNGSTDGNAMILTGGTITAGESIALSGTVTEGSGSGVSLSGTGMTAGNGDITVSGNGYDAAKGGLNVNGGNFSAQNTVLRGEAQRNNVGARLAGNLNVTQGNLSVTGVTHHFNTDNKGTYRGLSANGLTLNVSDGNLSLTGNVGEFKDRGPQTGGVVGLELLNSSLKANRADLTGASIFSGSGFILQNVTLSGGIAQGNNMTLSSNTSGANVTNTLNINGGLGYGALLSLEKAGIDNNTSVGLLTASQEDLEHDMGFSTTTGWKFDVSSLSTPSTSGDKTGIWTVAGCFTGINATTQGDITLTGMNLTDSALTGNSVTLQGANNASLTLQNTNLTATSGNVSLSANVATGNALVLSGSNITAGENISLSGSSVAGTGVTLNGATLTGGNVAVSGNVSSGTGAGVSLNNVTVSATSGNITMSGKGYDSGNGSLSLTGNNTFSAQDDTVLRGEAGRNNIGVLLGGNLNITQGNLSVTGVMNKFSTDYYNNFRPLKADGLVLNISDGSLSLAGNAVEYDGVGPQGGGTVALELLNSSLKANHADLSGLNVDSGSGFILNNVTLSGGIAQGNNMTFSSEGSDANVTNTLNINGGLGYGVLLGLENTGTDNNTSVGLIAVSQDDLEHYMNFSADTDWSFDAGSLNGATGGKAGNWTVGAFTGINATTKGNISLTGVSLKNSNLTGDSVTLQGANNASLTLQNTNLTATSGNVSLSANVSNGSALVLSGGNITAGENINLNGTATGGTGSGVSLTGVSMTASSGNISVNGTGFDANNGALHVSGGNFSAQNTVMEGTAGRNNTGTQLSGSINVTGGNLTVSGTTTRVNNVTDVRGIDARNTNINVSGTNASLNMTGTVNGDEDATQAPSVVGLDLSGTTTLNATRANLTGVSTAKGMGFILNASLSDSLKSTEKKNLILNSAGSDAAVHNYIGNRVDSGFIKHLIGAQTSIGSKTEVQQVNIYKQELTDIINATTGNDLTKDFGDWILSFNGINITKSGDINITGAGFSNSTLKAGGNLTLDNGPGNLSLNGSTLTATNGYVDLTGGSVNLTKGNVSAMTDININASNGLVSIVGGASGAGYFTTGIADITSQSGNISIYGDGAGMNQQGVLLQGVNLTADRGSISVSGYGNVPAGTSHYAGGVTLAGNVNFSSTSNNIYGHSSSADIFDAGGVEFLPGVFDFSGNTAIKGVAENGAGVAFNLDYPSTDFLINFSSGEHYSVDGSGKAGYFFSPWENKQRFRIVNVNVDGGTLNFSGSGTSGLGFGANYYSTQDSGYRFTGSGNVNIKGTSVSGNGVDSRYLNNTGLTGNFTVTGESQSGTGINVSYNTDWNIQNATITGTSGSGTGINISGNILHVTNVTLNGTSGGSGDGVQLTGGNNYIIDGVTVTGQSQDGSGVNISGTLNTINTTITGNASGNGSGVSLHGNVTGDAKENNIITGHSAQGSGLLVSGNSTATNVTLNGDTVDGNGIKVTGNLSVNNVVGYGNATGGGNGLNLAGNVSGGEWHGDAVNGTGVNVTGSSTLTNVSLSGTTEYGTGINVPGNLTSAGTTTVTGNATGNGTGAAVSGTLNGDIYGSSTSGTGAVVSDGTDLTHGSVTGTTNGPGDGVSLSGHVTGGVVTGHADNGAGVNISGNSTLTNVSVHGSTVHGTGVDVNGNLTNTGNTDVSGHASAGGTGVHIHQGNNVTGGSLAGTSVSGPGVVIDGDNTLSNTTVNGGSGSNSGLVLNGNVNGTGSVLSGQSGSGDGVNLNGTMTGGSLNAHSGSGAGLHITGDSWLKDVETTYDSDTGAPLLIDGLLSFTGGTLNGVTQGDQAAERHYLWLLQPPREQTSGPEQLMRMAGWQARDVPVGVDVCTDSGESSSCRHLDAGMRNRPSHP
ncbi:TPA: filamentous hemagglutinin N-terminal domain-containing protein [Salmonella enterica subsp. enterica serovar Oranienburg]